MVEGIEIAAVVLAAQDSEALHSDVAVHARPLAGQPVAVHVRDALLEAGVTALACVVGERQDQVRLALGEDMAYVLQDQRRGTGHAALQAASFLESRGGLTLIVPGVSPLITAASLRGAIDYAIAEGLDALLLTAQSSDPRQRDLVRRDEKGRPAGIECAPEGDRRAGQPSEISSGIYLFRSSILLSLLGKLGSSRDPRVDLSALLPLLEAEGRRYASWQIPEDEVLSIRTMQDFSHAEALLSLRHARRLMDAGVEILRPESSIFEAGVAVGRDARIAPGVSLRGETRIGARCVIERGAVIEHSRIGNDVYIGANAVISHSEIGDGCHVAPFAHLHSGCWMDRDGRVGAHADISNAIIGQGVRIESSVHICDADIGSESQIGSSTVTVYRDAAGRTGRTTVGQMALVGSGSELVAPLEIGDHAVVACGSTVTESVASFDLAIARSRQTSIPDWVRHRLNRRV